MKLKGNQTLLSQELGRTRAESLPHTGRVTDLVESPPAHALGAPLLGYC